MDCYAWLRLVHLKEITMRKDILSFFAVALFLAASVADAGVKGCNNTLVAQGVCGDNTQDVIYLRLAGTSRAEVVTALAKKGGWSANIVCNQARIDAGVCSAGQLGQTIANPETKAQAASRYLREVVKTAVRDEKVADITVAGAAALPPVEVTD